MLLILLFHTEVYYTGEALIPYFLYVENALAVFFVLSGYLFFNKEFTLTAKLQSILKGLILPYFLFTFLLTGMKSLFIGAPFDLQRILTGEASWFVATLIFAELVTTLLYSLLRNIHFIGIISGLLFLVSLMIPFPGILQVVPVALLFLYAGMVMRAYPVLSDGLKPYHALLLSVLLLLKYIELKQGMMMTVYGVDITSYPVFFADTLIFCDLFLSLLTSLKLKNARFIGYIGRNSLYYYFFCGAVPFAVNRLFIIMNFPYDGNYLRVLLAFVCIVALSTLVVMSINSVRSFARSHEEADGA